VRCGSQRGRSGYVSSQNEQDNRRYAIAAGLPMIDLRLQEAYDFFFSAIEMFRAVAPARPLPDDDAGVPQQVDRDGPRERSARQRSRSGSPFRARYRRQGDDPGLRTARHRRLRAKLSEIAAWGESAAADKLNRVEASASRGRGRSGTTLRHHHFGRLVHARARGGTCRRSSRSGLCTRFRWNAACFRRRR